MTDKSAFYIANTDAFVHVGDTDMHVHKGDRIRAGHALLRQAPGLFDPIENDITFDVEQATAAPGEKRGAKT